MNRRIDDDRDASVLDDRRDVPMDDNNDPQVPHGRENLLPEQNDDRPGDRVWPETTADTTPAGAPDAPHAGPGPVYGGRDELDDEPRELPEDTPGEVRQEVEPDSIVTPAHAVPGTETVSEDDDLFGQDVADVQRRWHDVQAAFVDDPRIAVERADELLGEVVTALTSSLRSRTERLQDGWKNGADADTEQLRLALRDYRSVLDRLTQLAGHGAR